MTEETKQSSASVDTAILSGTQQPHTLLYRPAIDGLRAIAVLAVLLFHLNRRWLPGGFVGVDVFFVISGYLITSILLRDCRSSEFSFGKFYQRRVARLFPAFFTVAFATLGGAAAVYSRQDLASAGAVLSAAALSVANLKLMLQGNYFVLSPDAQPFLHYWSLSVEEQFYLVFPGLLWLSWRSVRRYAGIVFLVAGVASFAACVWLTAVRPSWAFFLLPTRAWELLAGSTLAAYTTGERERAWRVPEWVPLTGLLLIAVSVVLVREGPAFPGMIAALPVSGTICVLAMQGGLGGVTESLLSWAPLVLIGRLSYSLYLWHWPVFSLVDYKFYESGLGFRLAAKLLLTAAMTALCFWLIETPGRFYFNKPKRRTLTFALAAAAVIVCTALGSYVRRENYVNAEFSDVAKGGLLLNASGHRGTMILMGDSNGSMYGALARSIAEAENMQLRVMSVAAGDPLPYTSGQAAPLWLDSLKTVKEVRPAILLIACDWRGKLGREPQRLQQAVDELKQYAGRVVLITQPPFQPAQASREAIREGSRGPYQEDARLRAERQAVNATVQSLAGGNVAVANVERRFLEADGSVRVRTGEGDAIYQDGVHLTAAGAALVRGDVMQAIRGH